MTKEFPDILAPHDSIKELVNMCCMTDWQKTPAERREVRDLIKKGLTAVEARHVIDLKVGR